MVSVLGEFALKEAGAKIGYDEWVTSKFDLTKCAVVEVGSDSDRRVYGNILSFGAKHFQASRFSVVSEAVSGKLFNRLKLDCIDLKVEGDDAEDEEVKIDDVKAAKSEDKADDGLEDVDKISKFRAVSKLGLGMFTATFQEKEIHVLHRITGGPAANGMLLYCISFIMLGKTDENYDLIQAFLNHILLESEPTTSSETIDIMSWNYKDRYWMRAGSKVKRPLESVFLPKALKSKLIGDISRFLSVKGLEFYVKHGIPYKRSYLFYGSPGCGKTSLIQSLAGFIGRNVCFMQPANPLMTDDNLKRAIQTMPARSVIVLEDVDALFDEKRKGKDGGAPLSFSGLLNAIDGVGDPDGQIFILTTNHPEKLDPALIRHGRVDLMLEFPTASKEQLKEMFQSFYPKEDALAIEFSEKIFAKFGKDAKISMAAIQHHFILHMFSSAAKCVKGVDAMEGDHAAAA